MRKLSSFSPEYEVMELLLNALKDFEEGNIIYDGENDRCIDIDDVENIIEQMKDTEEMWA